MTIPDYISPIIGHRVWQWNGSALVSLNGELWPSGRALEATCNVSEERIPDFATFFQQGNHKAPQSKCSCGIYATKSADQISYFRLSRLWMCGIYGEVHLWGTVVEHRLGWRAQFAYPRSLVLPTDMISSIDETESMLGSLTTYGADISLVNGETTATLWTKRSGYEKGGLNVLRSVANRPIETMLHVAVFARGEARLQLLQNQVKSAQIAQVVSGQVGFPVDVTDPIFLHVREQRVRVVLVDLNCQALEECLRAIRVIRLAVRNVTVFAIGDRHNRSMIDGSIRAGADEYLECNKVHEIIEALRLQLWLINTRGKRVPGRAQVGVRPKPLRGSPPSGGSTPPMAPVFAPINRGPRPMRPRAVALAM